MEIIYILQKIWLGAKRIDAQSPFRWEDDSSYLSQSYTNWGAGEPDKVEPENQDNQTTPGDCVAMAAHGTWHNIDCNEQLNNLCVFN